MTRDQKALLAEAEKAAAKAHAPYSNFHVGAAVLTDGGIFIGANIENACTNLGTCAERVAISHARMNGYTDIIGIAVSCVDAPRDEKGMILVFHATPCGGCRQWLAELAPEAWIVTNASEKIYYLSDLLPNPFVLRTDQ